MFGMLKKVGIVLALLSLLISGCASHKKLNRPIPLNSRIGVVANFRNDGLFQRAGTTAVDNSSFYRHVPGLSINALVTTSVANDLHRSRRFKVIPIYHRTAASLLSAAVIKRSRLSPEYKDYLSKLTRRKNLDTILLITPGDIDFGNGQYFGDIWWVTGYGLFNRAFVFMQTNTVFAAYNVYVIDAKTYRVLGKASGNLQKRAHGIDIAWHKGYGGVSGNTLKVVRDVLRKNLPASVASVVHKTGLP